MRWARRAKRRLVKKVRAPVHYVFLNSLFAKAFNHWLTSGLSILLLGFYLLFLDSNYGSNSDLVTRYPNVHWALFYFSISFMGFVQLFRLVSVELEKRVEVKTTKVIVMLSALFREIVKLKSDRFKDVAPSIPKKGDAFKKITQPKNQIYHILRRSLEFISSEFGVKSERISITIIHKNSLLEDWSPLYSADSAKHMKPSDLMKFRSCAKVAYEEQKPQYWPDIGDAREEGCFVNSRRSEKYEKGAIFCKPVNIQVGNITYDYIISFTVYGDYLGNPSDDIESYAVSEMLLEISERLELELFLFSMKEFRSTNDLQIGETA